MNSYGNALIPADAPDGYFDDLLNFVNNEPLANIVKTEEYTTNEVMPLIPLVPALTYINPPTSGTFQEPPPPARPKMHPSFICTEDYGGDYNFEVYINPHHGKKSPWMYSGTLEKLFITMNQNFPVDFKWDFSCTEKLFVRSTPVFSSPQHQLELVTRCIHHAQRSDSSNRDYRPEVWDHIMRCSHSNAEYFGSKADNKHLSVLVPLGRPQVGSDVYRCNYNFVCKNSCVTGMNRRAIDVIFTLENERGEIKGRRILGVRICSCPKRDKDKEEQEHHQDKSKNVPASSIGGKKRKLEKKVSSTVKSIDNKDCHEYTLKFNIIGKQNAEHILKTAHALMAAEMVQQNVEQPYKKCLVELAQKLSNPTEFNDSTAE